MARQSAEQGLMRIFCMILDSIDVNGRELDDDTLTIYWAPVYMDNMTGINQRVETDVVYNDQNYRLTLSRKNARRRPKSVP